MFNEWSEEFRNLLYEGDLDVAARSNAVMSLDGIISAQREQQAALEAQLVELNNKLTESQTAVTRLVLENSKHVAANVAVVEEVVEDVVEEVLDDAQELSSALDEL